MKKTRALIPVIESVTVQRAGGKQVVEQVEQVEQGEQVEQVHEEEQGASELLVVALRFANLKNGARQNIT